MEDIEFESEVWQPLAVDVGDRSCDGEAALVASASDVAQVTPGENEFTFEERRAICTLLVEAVSREEHLCDVFVGMLLPPPWRGVHCMCEGDGAEPFIVLRTRLKDCASRLPVRWREMVCLMPMNFALKSGLYDARLRVAMRRLCRFLGVEWSVVLKRESALSAVDLDAIKDLEKRGEQKGAILARKDKQRFSAKRVAAVGAFAAVGGVALFFTGGLAAPIIAPAFSALLGATTATLGFVGGIGSAILGGGAIAAAFAALIGIATHAAAMGALLTPILTAANLTAIFGVGGAGLAGFKGLKRTGASSRFTIRSVEDLETLPPLRVFQEDLERMQSYRKQLSDEDIQALNPATLREGSVHADPNKGDDDDGTANPLVKVVSVVTSIAQSSGGDFNDELFSQSKSGLVVPIFTVNVALRNVAASDQLETRSRVNVFAIEDHLDGVRLSLVGLKLNYGVWANVPAKEILPRHAAVAACHNKVARPTGAGGVVCYRLARYMPQPTSADSAASLIPVECPDLRFFRKEVRRLCADGGLKIWVMTHTSITNTEHLGVIIERPHCKLSHSEIVRRLEKDSVTENTSYTVDDILMVELLFQPKPRVILRFHPKLGRPSSYVSGSFPIRELEQQIEDTRATVHRRRVLTMVLKNYSTCTINVKSIQCHTGHPQIGQSFPSVLAANEGGLLIFTNNEFSFEGAAASLAIEVTAPTTDKSVVSAKLSSEVTALAQCHGTSLFHCGPLKTFPTAKEVVLPEMTGTKGKPIPVPSLVDPDTGDPITYISATMRVDDKKNQVEWCFADTSNRMMLSEVESQRLTITVAVCGFMDTIDPRRLLEDQQVAIWQPILRSHTLFSQSQGLVVDWEEEYLRRFSRTVGLLKGETLINEATSNVVHEGKKQLKRQILAGALFAGMRAFDALKGTIEMPLYAIMATDLIDNTFATLSNRSDYAGKDLAAALLSEQRGHRPVTLVGYSFGATVIAKCLEELHQEKALGIVENVYLLGGVFPSDLKVWNVMREVVAGRLVNIYCRSDWLLWTLYKSNDIQLKPLAGLGPIYGVPGVENIDASGLIDSHASYAIKLEPILNLIPDYPTIATLQQSLESGSPGALVPAGEALTAVSRIFSSMTGPLSDKNAGVVGVINRIESGGTFAEELQYVASKLHKGTAYDFLPVPTIPSGNCGLMGFVRSPVQPEATAASDDQGDGDDDDRQYLLSGVVGYSLDLNPVSKSSILLLVYFACEPDTSKGIRANSVAMSVTQREGESTDAFRQRLVSLVETHASSPEETVRIARMGPQEEGSDVTAKFSAVADNDWTIKMVLEEGGAICTLEGSVALEVLDETWSELNSRSLTEESVLWDQCPIERKDCNVPLESLGHVLDDVVHWGLQHVSLEVLSSARSTILSSSSTTGHILFPIVLINTTMDTMTLSSKHEDELNGAVSPMCEPAQWIRTPPNTLRSQSAAVLLVRIPVPRSGGAAFANAAASSPSAKAFSELYGCFSYRTDDAQFHFFLKMQWQPNPLANSSFSPSEANSASPTSALLGFNLKLQCVRDSETDNSTTDEDAVIFDTKRIDGVCVRFVFMRQPAALVKPPDACSMPSGTVGDEGAPAASVEKGADGTPWVSFDEEDGAPQK